MVLDKNTYYCSGSTNWLWREIPLFLNELSLAKTALFLLSQLTIFTSFYILPPCPEKGSGKLHCSAQTNTEKKNPKNQNPKKKIPLELELCLCKLQNVFYLCLILLCSLFSSVSYVGQGLFVDITLSSRLVNHD